MAQMPELMTRPTPQAVVDEHLDALNRGDWNRLMAPARGPGEHVRHGSPQVTRNEKGITQKE